MIRRNLVLKVVAALLIFGAGVFSGTAWKARSGPIKSEVIVTPPTKPDEDPPWPLSKEIVSRSLQTHSFRSNKLRRNSDDEIVWRWLKESISAYPQNWVKLNITDDQSYGVVLNPTKTLDSNAVNAHNRRIGVTGLPPLSVNKRYLPIDVYQGNLICPSWEGLIDIEEAKLVYFFGMSA